MKSNKQNEILNYVQKKLNTENYSPSVREIAEAVNLKSKSKNTAIENRKLQGKVKMTILQGEVAYSN